MRKFVIAALFLLSSTQADSQVTIPSGPGTAAIKAAAPLSIAPDGTVSCANGNCAGPAGPPGPANLQGYIYGLGLANDAVNPPTVIDVSPGVATSDDGSAQIVISTLIYKNANAAFSAGVGGGCLDSGTAIPSSGTLHFFAVNGPSAPDVVCSISPTTPTLPTGYTAKRRVGSIPVRSSAFVQFSQSGAEFLLKGQKNDVPATTLNSGSRTCFALTVPTGIQVKAKTAINFYTSPAQPQYLYISSPDQDDIPASSTNYSTYSAPTAPVTFLNYDYRTDTSGRICASVNTYIAAPGSYFTESTLGWIDQP